MLYSTNAVRAIWSQMKFCPATTWSNRIQTPTWIRWSECSLAPCSYPSRWHCPTWDLNGRSATIAVWKKDHPIFSDEVLSASAAFINATSVSSKCTVSGLMTHMTGRGPFFDSLHRTSRYQRHHRWLVPMTSSGRCPPLLHLDLRCLRHSSIRPTTVATTSVIEIDRDSKSVAEWRHLFISVCDKM